MSGIVVFDPTTFKEIYPQFADYADVRLNHFFEQAEQILNNTASSIVQDLKTRSVLLNLLVCHIAELDARGSQVGTTSSASEGSVSVGFSVPQITNGEYFTQTQCGLTFWQMSLKYRLGGKYITPKCRPC